MNHMITMKKDIENNEILIKLLVDNKNSYEKVFLFR